MKKKYLTHKISLLRTNFFTFSQVSEKTVMWYKNPKELLYSLESFVLRTTNNKYFADSIKEIKDSIGSVRYDSD